MPNVSTEAKIFSRRILKCNFKVGAKAWYSSSAWYLLHAGFLTYFVTLKMEETCSSETLVDYQRTARYYIQEDRTLHVYRCENLRAYIVLTAFSYILLLTVIQLQHRRAKDMNRLVHTRAFTALCVKFDMVELKQNNHNLTGTKQTTLAYFSYENRHICALFEDTTIKQQPLSL
jgi:hypothetical protein